MQYLEDDNEEKQFEDMIIYAPQDFLFLSKGSNDVICSICRVHLRVLHLVVFPNIGKNTVLNTENLLTFIFHPTTLLLTGDVH